MGVRAEYFSKHDPLKFQIGDWVVVRQTDINFADKKKSFVGCIIENDVKEGEFEVFDMERKIRHDGIKKNQMEHWFGTIKVRMVDEEDV